MDFSLVKWIVGQDGLMTLGGAFVGAAVTQLINWRQASRMRKSAQMQVASYLRRWAVDVRCMVCDVQTYGSSEGCGGQQHTVFPPLELESKMGVIGALRPRSAEQVFELIHQKAAANARIAGAIEYWADEDDALDEFRREGAKLYLSAVDIYEQFARNLRWSGSVFSKDEKDDMAAELVRAYELEAIRTRAAEEV